MPRRGTGEPAAETAAEVPAVEVAAETAAEVPGADPMRPVKVRNTGTASWVGSDYKWVGSGVINPGEVGTVTAKKAEDLVRDYAGGPDGKGPFEIVEE